MKHVEDPEALFMVDTIDSIIDDFVEHHFRDDKLEQVLFNGMPNPTADSEEERAIREIVQQLHAAEEFPARKLTGRLPLPSNLEPILPAHVKTPVLELKGQEARLVELVKKHKGAGMETIPFDRGRSATPEIIS
ncbi:hypothetical protein C2S53_017319 [Perilla frutescens var. hirtella]|uniref:Uncharacterized protein n=1 Tax=Perilla frutescens var. hirtella TaxID=608512 RepID=A0AAD4J0G3_PERFH|nr:hypothetical protein C2S53_017319 [Perilla frutescens var. hirtella]